MSLIIKVIKAIWFIIHWIAIKLTKPIVWVVKKIISAIIFFGVFVLLAYILYNYFF